MTDKRTLTRREMLRRSTIAMALTQAGCAGLRGRGPEKQRPNFVFIYADDLGYGDLGCYGAEQIKTPWLDQMAREGMRFTSFYSCACVCTPSRAGLLTGRYPVRSGLLYVLFPTSQTGIDDSEITLAEALKQGGYTTACVGKWHLGHLPPFLPTRHGFDRYFGIPYSNDMSKSDRGHPPIPLMRNETVIEQPVDQHTLTQRYTAQAVQFIRESKDRPFFLYVAHTMPHVPLYTSAAFEGRSTRGLYGDVVEELDWSAGQILEEIHQQGLAKNTLVVFSSDNGPWLVQREHGGSAGPLRDGKATTFEGGVREPCIAWWPGRIAAGAVEREPAIMLDWFPTFLSLAGGQAPTERIIDGRDISPVLFGTGPRGEAEFYFYRGERLEAHRSGPWKLKKVFDEKKPPSTDKGLQPLALLLFNLDDDPDETADLAAAYPDIAARLQQQMDEFQQSLGLVPAPKR